MFQTRIYTTALTIVFAFCCLTVEGAVISSVTLQSGEQADRLPQGRLVRIGTFSNINPNLYTEIKLSGVAKNAIHTLGVDLPRLYFTKPNLSIFEFLLGYLTPSVMFPAPIATDVVVQTHSDTQLEHTTSGFVPLTHSQTVAINALLSANGNKLEAWMVSDDMSDFYFPDLQESIVSIFPLVIQTELFSAELSFVAVPEPKAILPLLVLGLFTATVRKRRKMSLGVV